MESPGRLAATSLMILANSIEPDEAMESVYVAIRYAGISKSHSVDGSCRVS